MHDWVNQTKWASLNKDSNHEDRNQPYNKIPEEDKAITTPSLSMDNTT